MFIEGNTVDGNYINITNNNSGYCQARIGYERKAGQLMNLPPGCMDKGRILHEVMHSIGFYHEHQVPGRNKHVVVNEDNVLPDFKADYKELLPSQVRVFDYLYDYKSITHYGAFGGANGNLVMYPVDYERSEHMGQRRKLSRTDVNKINSIYNCASRYFKA